MHNFKKLKVWEDAVNFCTLIYSHTKLFPDDERFGLTSQLRRASVSISANIAEGSGRRTNENFRQFLYIAIGSVKECESLLFICQKLGFVNSNTFNTLMNNLESLARRLYCIIKSL